jgi:hypothetical protein
MVSAAFKPRLSEILQAFLMAGMDPDDEDKLEKFHMQLSFFIGYNTTSRPKDDPYPYLEIMNDDMFNPESQSSSESDSDEDSDDSESDLSSEDEPDSDDDEEKTSAKKKGKKRKSQSSKTARPAKKAKRNSSDSESDAHDYGDDVGVGNKRKRKSSKLAKPAKKAKHSSSSVGGAPPSSSVTLAMGYRKSDREPKEISKSVRTKKVSIVLCFAALK